MPAFACGGVRVAIAHCFIDVVVWVVVAVFVVIVVDIVCATAQASHGVPASAAYNGDAPGRDGTGTKVARSPPLSSPRQHQRDYPHRQRYSRQRRLHRLRCRCHRLGDVGVVVVVVSGPA